MTKPVTQGFSLITATVYLGISQPGASMTHGRGNISVGGVWQVYRNADTESIGSFSISDSIACSGSRAMRDDYSSWSSEFDFGNAHATWKKPFALTGAVGLDLPADSYAPRMLD